MIMALNEIMTVCSREVTVRLTERPRVFGGWVSLALGKAVWLQWFEGSCLINLSLTCLFLKIRFSMFNDLPEVTSITGACVGIQTSSTDPKAGICPTLAVPYHSTFKVLPLKLFSLSAEGFLISNIPIQRPGKECSHALTQSLVGCLLKARWRPDPLRWMSTGRSTEEVGHQRL